MGVTEFPLTDFFALLKGPMTLRHSTSGLFNSCHNRPIQPNEHAWCIYCQEKKENWRSNTKSAVKAVTIQAPPDSATLTTSSLLQWLKAFCFSDSSESTCLPERPLVYDWGMGLFTKYSSQLHGFKRKRSNSTGVKKRVGKNRNGVPAHCLLRSCCQE